jgi:hypothetical protein
MAQLQQFIHPDTGQQVEIFSRTYGTEGTMYIVRRPGAPDHVTADELAVTRIRRDLRACGFIHGASSGQQGHVVPA